MDLGSKEMLMDKLVVITGSSQGIGKACATYFKYKGWVTIGLDVKKRKLCDQYYNIDVSNPQSIKKLAQEWGKKKIKIQALVNNAAIQIEKSILHTSDDEWDRVIKTNLYSQFYLVKYLYPLFKAGSAIVNISSVHAKATSGGLGSYVASKGGVSALTRVLSLELADKKIRVNEVCPGAIDTPMLKAGLVRNKNIKKARQKLILSSPLKRIGMPSDIAKLAFFLCDNEQSSNITGQEFVCDSGVLARLASES